MPVRSLAFAFVATVALALPAGAEGPPVGGRPPPGAAPPRQADPACYCWAGGRKFQPGERACLRTPAGSRLATCDMVINMMSWTLGEESCPES